MRVVVLTALLVSCASQSGLGRAKTLAPGRAQVTPLAELSFVSAKFEAEKASTAPWLLLGVGYRRGLTERLELGVRGWGFGWPGSFTTTGAAADLKVQLLDAGEWHLAMVASVRYHLIELGTAPWHVVGAEAPVLLGKDVGPHQLILGLKVSDHALFGPGTNPINSVWVGAQAGLAIEVRPGVEVTPEMGLIYSPVPFNGETRDPRRLGASVLTLGLSVSVDSVQPSLR